jgi:hypothetical protein
MMWKDMVKANCARASVMASIPSNIRPLLSPPRSRWNEAYPIFVPGARDTRTRGILAGAVFAERPPFKGRAGSPNPPGSVLPSPGNGAIRLLQDPSR